MMATSNDPREQLTAVYQQDGIAFAGMHPVRTGDPDYAILSRGEEIEHLFGKTLSTYYPG